MKQYIVKQKCRCCFNVDENDGKHISPLRFSADIDVGTYSEADFKALVGDEFFKKGFFAKYCANDWIAVVETKDVTTKVASKSLDIL